MDDKEFDAILHAHFKEKMPLEDSLIARTKMRLWEKAEKKNNILLCIIQIYYWLTTLAFSALAIITIGVNLIVILLVIGCIVGMSLVGTSIILVSSNSHKKTTRRNKIHV